MNAKEKCGEEAYKKLPANSNNPISTRTRQATSVPVENSEGTTRRECVSPHPPHKGIKLILTFSTDEEGTPYQSGGVGRLRLRRNKATGPPTMTFREGVVTRARKLTSAPVEKSAMDARLTALDRTSPRATGFRRCNSQRALTSIGIKRRGRSLRGSLAYLRLSKAIHRGT